MRSSIALLSTAVLGVVARSDSTTVTSIFRGGPATTGQAWAGSVANVGPSDTTFHVICTSGSCGPSPATQTVTLGPSNLDFEYETTTLGQAVGASETCALTGTTRAVCTIEYSISLPVGDTTVVTSSAIVTTFTGSEMGYYPLTLTAGVEKLASETGSASVSASGSGSSSTSSTGSASASSSASGSGSAASGSSSGSGASSIMSNGKGGNVLAMAMFSAVTVSVGALMIL